MVSTLDFRSGGRWFEPGLCRRVVSLDKKLYSTLSLFTQMYIKWVPAIIMLGDNLEMDYSIPDPGEYSKSLHATETGVKRRPDGPLGSYADFTLPLGQTNLRLQSERFTSEGGSLTLATESGFSFHLNKLGLFGTISQFYSPSVVRFSRHATRDTFSPNRKTHLSCEVQQ